MKTKEEARLGHFNGFDDILKHPFFNDQTTLNEMQLHGDI